MVCWCRVRKHLELLEGTLVVDLVTPGAFGESQLYPVCKMEVPLLRAVENGLQNGLQNGRKKSTKREMFSGVNHRKIQRVVTKIRIGPTDWIRTDGLTKTLPFTIPKKTLRTIPKLCIRICI